MSAREGSPLQEASNGQRADRSILVPVFFDGGWPAKESLAVLSEATKRAAELGGEATAVVTGAADASDAALARLRDHGAARVFRGDGDPRIADSWTRAVSALLSGGTYAYVLMAGGPLALAVAGAVAAHHHGAVVTDVTALCVTAGALLAERPVFRNSQVATVGFKRRPGVIVARAGAFPRGLRHQAAGATSLSFEVSRIPEWNMRDPQTKGYGQRVRVIGSDGLDDPGRRLAQADVIVTGGRGLGGADRFTELEALAAALGEHLGESAVGATRAVVDAGWRDVHDQIGLTGRTVTPQLYVAVAVSGAPQHRSGMETSEHILAINKDARAPIFTFCDLGVVSDFEPLITRLTNALRSRRG